MDDPNFHPFFERLSELLTFLLPTYVSEGKTHLTIAFGCTGGQHRSVTLTERMAKALADSDWQVSIDHRDLDHQAVKGSDGAVKVGRT
jgi:UPF0042 nucleotide-binding protein